MITYVLDARTATPHYPGIGRYVVNLVQKFVPLLGKNEHLTVLYDSTQALPWSQNTLNREKLNLVRVGLSSFSLAQQWVVPRLLQKLGADFYHSPYYLMPYRPGVPTLLTAYDIIPLHYPHYVSIQARLLFRWTNALALRTATHVTAISEATKQDFLKTYHLPANKVTTVHLAAAPNFQPQPTAKINLLRARLKLPEKYILYLGSNKPHKNLLRLVEAWAKIQPQSISLVIAGAWDSRYPESKQQVETLQMENSIHFLGPVTEEDIPVLYSGAYAFIFPSEYEGFGLPVLEAMACGVPVACANTSSLPEVAGDAALFFEPTDINAIAGVLEQLMCDANLQANLRERSLLQAAQFSWEQTAQKTLNLYRKMTK